MDQEPGGWAGRQAGSEQGHGSQSWAFWESWVPEHGSAVGSQRWGWGHESHLEIGWEGTKEKTAEPFLFLSYSEFTFQIIMKSPFLYLSLLKTWVSFKDNETKFIWFISAKQIAHIHTHIHTPRIWLRSVRTTFYKDIQQTQEHAVSAKQTWAVRSHHRSPRVLHSSVVAQEKTKTKQNPVHIVSSRPARATW